MNELYDLVTSIENQHDDLVKDLVKPPIKLVCEATSAKLNLNHMCLGLAGEVGEVIDVVKRHTIYDQPLDLNHLKEELGDLEFYLKGIRLQLGIKREELLRGNIEKLKQRYGQRYSDSAAKDRKDKQ